MTAQVGILNSEVVILASDTASTITGSENVKIFKSTKKIFKISDNIPVAIMVNGKARFAGVPWKRIVDLYRKSQQELEKDKLKDYYDSFLDFIEKHPDLTDYERNYTFFTNWVLKNYDFLEGFGVKRGKIDKEKFLAWIRDKNEKLDKVSSYIIDSEKEEKVSKSIEDFLTDCLSFRSINYPKFLKEYFKDISKYLTSLFMKNVYKGDSAGLIVAGFGQSDIFPELIQVDIEGLFENKLRKAHEKHFTLGNKKLGTNKGMSSVLPFAQSEGAQLIMEGISGDLKAYVIKKLKNDKDSVISYIKDHELFGYLDKTKRLKILSDLNEYTDLTNQEFIRNFNQYIKKYYSKQIIDSIKFMGEADLATFAKTIVHLTSLKRFYSIDQKETAGGETDVILLNKEKGFVDVSVNTKV